MAPKVAKRRRAAADGPDAGSQPIQAGAAQPADDVRAAEPANTRQHFTIGRKVGLTVIVWRSLCLAPYASCGVVGNQMVSPGVVSAQYLTAMWASAPVAHGHCLVGVRASGTPSLLHNPPLPPALLHGPMPAPHH